MTIIKHGDDSNVWNFNKNMTEDLSRMDDILRKEASDFGNI